MKNKLIAKFNPDGTLKSLEGEALCWMGENE